MPDTVILILGPTCVGKSETAIELTKALKTELISADSMQIYKYMDIGTGKPSLSERQGIKHHMIDIVLPEETYSVGRYIEDVIPVINTIHEKNKIPVVVGGTGLYTKAMTRGLFPGPSADWSLRGELLRLEEESKGILYENLRRLDPTAAENIMPTDLRRILRSLEVSLKSNEKMSELKARLTKPLPYEFIKIGLMRERKELYGMIEKRVEDMIARGLVHEVNRLLSMNPSSTSMQAIGYKEIASYLKGNYPLDEAIRLIKRNTKRYAKRQFTWFKKEEGIHWIDVTGIFSGREIYNKVSVLFSLTKVNL
ncbi:MAG: tRNA (adenosine(37)-N6)-dimethylallyltransferase MiaA [Nitrospirae bacterium]|nr:tRNA (adenosine(37)-N6)-dimethylallyltransferase MiaA [Nitrospirota bacterium]